MRVCFVVAYIILVGLALGSEMEVSLESKVNRSELVCLVTRNWFSESEEKYQVSWRDRALSRVTISFTVDKILKGIAERTIVVHAYNSTGTAGFTPNSLKRARRFLAYLKKGEGDFYELTGPSNQYLEDIGPHGVSVRALGQTSERVSLKEKLAQINALSKNSGEKGN